MKIPGLNGSPKKERSDTLHVTRAFQRGMEDAAPQEVHLVHAAAPRKMENARNLGWT